MASEQKDTFASLPATISDNILSYLDGKSLLACCCVNKEWNRLMSSANVIWFRACKDAGLATDSEASRVNDWRVFFIMKERMSKAENGDSAEEHK